MAAREQSAPATDPAEVADDFRDREDVDSRYIVPGLARGLFVLQLFNSEQIDMTLAEIADKSGLSRSAAYRLIYTLEKEGFLARDDSTRRYSLTSRVLTLGFTYLKSRPLNEIVYPFLRRISQATRTASHLVELDGTETLYLARVAPAARVISNLQVGMRLPAHAAVSGRVLLSYMDPETLRSLYPQMVRNHPNVPPLPLNALLARAKEDAKRGYVLDNSVFDPGIRSFAAPVIDGAGQAVAALNIVGPEAIFNQIGTAEDINAIVGEEARALSRLLGGKF